MTDNVVMDENGIANMAALYAIRIKTPITPVDINPDDQQIASLSRYSNASESACC